jgi:hypothetical protein
MDRGQETVDDEDGHRTDGQVDVEDPVPAEGVGQPPAEQRPDHRGDTEDRAEETLVATSFAGCEQVADDRERDGEDGAGADTLDTPEQDKALHRPRQASQG